MHTLELQAQDELLFKSLCCYYLLECSWDVNTFYKINLSIFLTSMSITMSITMSIINMSLFFQNFDVIAKNTWHILVCFFAVCIIIISMFVTSVLDNLLLVLLIIIAKTYELLAPPSRRARRLVPFTLTVTMRLITYFFLAFHVGAILLLSLSFQIIAWCLIICFEFALLFARSFEFFSQEVVT